MHAFFSEELTKLQASLRKGLGIKEYQSQDNIHQALVIALDILCIFNREHDRYYSDDSVQYCLEHTQDGFENKWKDFSDSELLERMLASVGILAVDIGRPNEAISLFNILVQISPGSIHCLLGLAYAKLYIGSANDALEVIRDKIMNLAPGNDLGLAFLALAYEQLNQPEEALAAASAVITANRDESAVSLAHEVRHSLGQPAG